MARLEIRNIPSSKLTLSYENQVLRSPTQALTRGLVGRVLGPTYSGEGGLLSYPGITLSASSSKSTASRDDQVERITILPKDEGILPPVISLTKVVVHVRLRSLGIAKISQTRESRSIIPILSTSILGKQLLRTSYSTSDRLCGNTSRRTIGWRGYGVGVNVQARTKGVCHLIRTGHES